jgi:hypothetical protein
MRKVFLLAVTMAVAGAASRSLVAQSQATPPAAPSRQSEEERKLIQGVADTLKEKQAAAAKKAAVPKNWKPARLPWGDPDLSGVYTNSDESGIPFERPAEFEGRRLEDVTGEELAKIQATRRAAIVENAVRASAEPNPQLFWWETLNAANSRAWLVVDPPDGKVPPQTPDGKRRAAIAAARPNVYNTGSDSYEERGLYDRCITRGIPGSMMPAIYGSSYEIHQGPGYVAVRYEMIHETRVIPLDDHPHVSKAIRMYMGDARGHWEGDTLVVETTNFKDQAAYRGADGGTLHLIERFKPIGPESVQWSVTADDPSTWIRPWTFAMNLTKKDQSQQPFEYACHEGNYGLRNILSAARSQDKAAQDKEKDAER